MKNLFRILSGTCPLIAGALVTFWCAELFGLIHPAEWMFINFHQLLIAEGVVIAVMIVSTLLSRGAAQEPDTDWNKTEIYGAAKREEDLSKKLNRIFKD